MLKLGRKEKHQKSVEIGAGAVGHMPGIQPTQDRPAFLSWYPIWFHEPARSDI